MVGSTVTCTRILLLRIYHTTPKRTVLNVWQYGNKSLDVKSSRVCNCEIPKLFSTSSYRYQDKKEEATANVVESNPSESNKNTLQTSFAEKAKDNAATASYGMVIVVGLTVVGYIFYTVLNELFSSDSPQALYEKSARLCTEHTKVQDMLGEPIKAFGEENRRGRRNRVSHLMYQDENGRKGIRLQFYLQGSRNRGTVQLDAREDESGHFQTRFLLVNVEDFLRNTIIVQDNR